jgi:hypothetical protein
LQWYGNDPFDANVKRNESPGARRAEPNAAVFEVTVWLAAPVFVQQTAVPGATVFDPCWKEKSMMLIVVSPAMHVPAA